LAEIKRSVPELRLDEPEMMEAALAVTAANFDAGVEMMARSRAPEIETALRLMEAPARNWRTSDALL
jgi:hypothetical protein